MILQTFLFRVQQRLIRLAEGDRERPEREHRIRSREVVALREGLKRQPRWIVGRQELFDRYLSLQQLEGAAHELQALEELGSGDELRKLRLLIAAGDGERARSLADALRARQRDDPRVIRLCADVEILEGKPDAARTLLLAIPESARTSDDRFTLAVLERGESSRLAGA